MLDDGSGRSATDRETLIRSVVSSWRVSLADFTAGNPLLHLTPGSTDMVEVSRPGPDDVIARLRAGGSFAFRSLKHWQAGAGMAAASDGQPAGHPPPVPYILDADMAPDALDAALQGLMKRSDEQHRQWGLPVLYLAYGTLTWIDQDRARRISPLLMVPVRLVAAGPGQPLMLEPAEHDPVMNLALTLALSRHRITLPPVDDLTQAALSGLLAGVRAAVSAMDGWLASESLVLSCFPPMKEEMYRDLLDHEEVVGAHPTVRALAARALARPGHTAGEVTGQEASGPAPAGVHPLVLDADSSQRACVTAALTGRWLTVEGPSGTGKSQTIANMVGALLHAGKTVLVVAANAPALDVVADRLTDAGLGGCLLKLYSRNAARSEVAASLSRALDMGSAADPASTAEDGARRAQLDAYAQAMSRVDDPLGYSLHDVCRMLANLRDVPAAPPLGAAPVHLGAPALGEVRRAAAALAAAWRPATQGQSFVWREVTERSCLDERLYHAASALEALAEVARPNQVLADACGLRRPSDAPALGRLLDHLLNWPEGLPDGWLTADTLDVAEVAVAQLTATLTAVAARESQASEAAGVPWSAIPRPAARPAVDTGALAALNPSWPDVTSLTDRLAAGLASEVADAADRLGKWYGTLCGMSAMLGLRAPVTFTDANDLLSLARLAGEPDRPERDWLSVRGYRAASSAVQILYDAHRTLAHTEGEASAYFTSDVLNLDVDELAQRFANDYRRLGRLSGDYRADRRTVGAFTRTGVAEDRALQHLGLAAAWQRAAQALSVAEMTHAALLGRHYAGRGTDFARIGRALTNAATALRCARGQDLSRAADHICGASAASSTLVRVAEESRRELSAWQASLAPSHAASHQELLNGVVTEAIGGLRAHVEPLYAASEFTGALSAAVGRSLTFAQARHLLALREAAEEAHEQLAARDSVFRDVCGKLYAGAETEVMAVRGALEWARRLRVMLSGGPGPLTPASVAAAENAVPTERLGDASDTWREACAALLSAFSPHRRQELAAELDDYEAGHSLLEAMFNDTSGRDEWHAHQAARAGLAALGLDSVAAFCVAERFAAAQVPQVVERALLLEWAELRVGADPALALLRSAGHDGLVSAYQRLERVLAARAAEDIRRACDARRPDADTIRKAAILVAAANEKRTPVREMLGPLRHIAQALAPCFLVTPPAVSRFLPSGMHFDVAIADEASQLAPADALNCFYRATTAVLAGDRERTPPGFQSVLGLAAESAAFDHLTLRWRYVPATG